MSHLLRRSAPALPYHLKRKLVWLYQISNFRLSGSDSVISCPMDSEPSALTDVEVSPKTIATPARPSWFLILRHHLIGSELQGGKVGRRTQLSSRPRISRPRTGLGGIGAGNGMR